MSTTSATVLGHAVVSEEESIAPLCECASDTPHSVHHGARQWRDLVWLAVLWLLHAVGNFWWLSVDTRPPYSDTAGHAITTLRMASWPWREWVMDGGIVSALLHVNPYPPFFYVTTLPFAWFVSPSVDAMLAVNTLYLGLLIFATYGIGRLLVGGRVGLLAAFLVSMYPMIYGLSRHYVADIALTAMVGLAVFCLVWSRAFVRREPSLLLGVIIGIGVLTKWTFIVFFVGPLAIAVYLTLRQPTRTRLINLVGAGLISLLIGLPWFLVNREALQAFLEFNQFLAAPQEGEAPIWSVDSWIYYLNILLLHQVLLPFTLLFGVGMVLVVRRCRLNVYVWMLISWLVVGYVASTLFINKDARYTMPYLPALALLTAIGLVQIRHQWLRWGGLALIVLYALFQFTGLTVGLSGRVAGLPTHSVWIAGKLAGMLYAETVHIAAPARAEDWQIDAILAATLADAHAHGVATPINLLVVPTMAAFDPQAFSYTQRRDRLPVEISFVTGILTVDSRRVLQQSDYVLTKDGELGWDFVLQEAGELTTQLLDPTSALAAGFERIGEFALPDGSTAFLLRHLPHE